MTYSTPHRARVWSYGAIFNRVKLPSYEIDTASCTHQRAHRKLTKLLHKKLIRICTNMSGLVNNATANTNDDRTESEFTSVSDGGLVEGRGCPDSMEGSDSEHSLTRTASDYCSLLNILNDKKELYVLYLKHSNYLLTTYCVGIYCLAFLFE
jgi:hypothetical protein